MKNFILAALVSCATLAGAESAEAASAHPSLAARLAASGIRDAGRASARQPVQITVTFAHRHANELAALIEAQSNRTSPLRGHYLTPSQFDAYFGPAPATVASVSRTLARAGFVAESATTGTMRRYVGTAGAADAAFGTEIHTVVQPGFGTRYASVRSAQIPAALASDVAAVSGFDDLSARPAPAMRSASALSARRALAATTSTPAATPAPSATPASHRGGNTRCTPKTSANTVDIDQPLPAQDTTVGYSPATFESDFDLPIENGCGGKGVTIGVLGTEEPAASDIAQYYSRFGISRTLPPYTVRQATGPAANGDAGEATLDIDLVTALAPDAAVVFYENDQTASGLIASLNQAASDNTISVFSISFVYCEVYDSGATSIAADSAVQQLAAQGITVVAATGDTGYQSCFGNPGIGAPATSAYAVTVGGVGPAPGATDAYRTARGGWSGSGGGTSQYVAKGKYQNGIAACSTSYRCIPDIAIASGVGTYPIASTATQGTYLFLGGSPFALSGTSMSAPIFSAMQAEADQYAGRRMGFINPLLYVDYYVLGSSTPSDPFQISSDVTTGNNGEPATKGWDFVTGLGVPDGLKLARVESLI